MLVKIIGPIFSILIARLLSPTDYGLYALSVTIISFLSLFKDLGISQAIIIDHGKEDFFSLQFLIQSIMAIILYTILLIFHENVNVFFEVGIENNLLLLMGSLLFIYALQDPIVTKLLKENGYKTLFYRQVIPALTYGISAFLLALKGFGVYSLVYATLFSQALITVVLYYKSRVLPKIYFDMLVFKRLFLLGKHLIFQKINGFVSIQTDTLIVGKNMGTELLGVYKMGAQLTNLIPNTIMVQVQQVVFTDISKNKNNLTHTERRYRQFSYLSYISMLIYSLVVVSVSPYLVPLVLGDQWLGVIPLMQVFSLGIPTGYLVMLNSELAKIYGFAHIYSYYGVFRGFFTIVMIIIGSLYSVKMVAILLVFSILVSNFINQILFYKFQKMIKFEYWKLGCFFVMWIYAAIVIMNI